MTSYWTCFLLPLDWFSVRPLWGGGFYMSRVWYGLYSSGFLNFIFSNYMQIHNSFENSCGILEIFWVRAVIGVYHEEYVQGKGYFWKRWRGIRIFILNCSSKLLFGCCAQSDRPPENSWFEVGDSFANTALFSFHKIPFLFAVFTFLRYCS